MSAPEVDQLHSFFPVDAVIRDGKPQIEWLRMPDVSFSEPFFHQTVERARQTNPESLFTDASALLQVTSAASPQPAGLIFHTSRCGSTVVANTCRVLDSTRVIAEAPVVDKLITRLFTDAEKGSDKELVYLSLIRAAVQSFARDPLNTVRRYFIKFASTSVLHINSLRRLWPNVPFLILFRDPVEITVSNLQNRPYWMNADSNPAAAAAIVGVEIHQLTSMSAEEFCARALGRCYAAVESAACDRSTLLINYTQLSLQTLKHIIEFFGVTPSAQELTAIERSLLSHSKDSTRSFQSDSAEKKAAASIQVIESVEKWALADYESLRRTVSGVPHAIGLR